ncbi:unnamed protein product, partial [Effrenium voratum]
KMLYDKYKDNAEKFEEVCQEQAWLELVFKQKQEKPDPKYKQSWQLRQLVRGREKNKSCLEQLALEKAKVWSTELKANRIFIVLDDEDNTQAEEE